jgi:hypothetical protein
MEAVSTGATDPDRIYLSTSRQAGVLVPNWGSTELYLTLAGYQQSPELSRRPGSHQALLPGRR